MIYLSTQGEAQGDSGERFMKKSISQFRAEKFVTECLIDNLSLGEIEHAAARINFSSIGHTRWFRTHVNSILIYLKGITDFTEQNASKEAFPQKTLDKLMIFNVY